jgi:hypothetical protein
MEGIYNATDDFPFSKLVLLKPTSVLGGNYFIKFRLNEMPLYIQTPKCNTKNGIFKAGRKYFSDLMFTIEHESFIQWIEKLENYCQKYIYEHRATWFDTELEMHDIENSFSSCFKLYKSGKYYIVRSYVPTQLGSCSLKIYNENEEAIDHSEINDTNDIITILEIQGIKCSARSFQIEIEIKQMLVLRPTNLFEKCILSPGHTKHQSSVINANNINKRTPDIGTSSGEQREEREQERAQEFHRMKDSVNNHTNVSLSCDDVEYPERSGYNVLLQENDKDLGKLNQSSQPLAFSDNSGILSGDDKPSPDNSRTLPLVPSVVRGTSTARCNSSDVLLIIDSDELKEVDFSLDEIPESDQIQIKTRNDVYYKMYQDAKQKAKMAKALALSSYLEAKRIKNTYMLEDLDDSDSDLDEDTITE